MRRPGRGKPEQGSLATVRDRAYVRFLDVYRRPFLEQWPEQKAATEMLDIVSDAIFNLDTLKFHAVDKGPVFATFMETYEAEDGSLVTRTNEDAEAGLNFLVEKNMVMLEGDWICIHPRFAVMLADLPIITPKGRLTTPLGYTNPPKD